MKKHIIKLRNKISKDIMIFNTVCGKQIFNYHIYKIKDNCKKCYGDNKK